MNFITITNPYIDNFSINSSNFVMFCMFKVLDIYDEFVLTS